MKLKSKSVDVRQTQLPASIEGRWASDLAKNGYKPDRASRAVLDGAGDGACLLDTVTLSVVIPVFNEYLTL
ncbi:MAG: hypothetical protein M3347_01285, partial [Armatimonadota bacterium]|nr:hypothetical protein [Armatimonadota bacterium]